MLVTVAMMGLGLMAVKKAVREMKVSGQLVAGERALNAAQAAADLAVARMRTMTAANISAALTGYGTRTCTDACGDCLPGVAGAPVSGQRNSVLAGGVDVGCAGRVCMRQGAVVQLSNATGSTARWCDVALSDLVANADAEATVTVWVRNNVGDALGPGGSGQWEVDSDGSIVVTALATVNGMQVAVEEEVALLSSRGPSMWQMPTPDEGYGGGHNNDNTSVSVCTDDAATAARVQ